MNKISTSKGYKSSPDFTEKDLYGRATFLCRGFNETESKYNSIRKTTRAAYTTSENLVSVEGDKKILFIVPRNAIAEKTFPDTIKIANKKGAKINGFIISANVKSCLLLTLEAEKYERENGKELDTGIPTPRPDCKTCPYSNTIVTPGINEPIFKSDTTNMKCALATIKAKRHLFNTGFVTYSKIKSLLTTPSEESNRLLEWLLNFDIIVMDEISQFVESTEFQVQIFSKYKDPDRPNFDFLDELMKDLRVFLQSENKNDEITNQIIHYCDIFDQVFDKKKYKDCQRIENPVPLEERKQVLGLNMILYLSALYHHKITYPSHRVDRIFKTLQLLTEDEWFVSKTQSMTADIDISFIVPPKTKEIVNWLKDYEGKVFISDATMPWQKLDRIFGEEIKELNLGDPNQTADKQLVICDTRSISPGRLFSDMERLRKYIDEIVKLHTIDKFLIILPNERLYKRFLREFPEIQEENVTYYRSSKTIGVANDLRTMVVLSTPYAPQNAFDGLAVSMGYKRSAGRHIWRVNASSHFFQTISRSKDPKGQTQSVIYEYGIKGGTAKTLLKDVVGEPRIVSIPLLRHVDNGHVLIASYWHVFNEVLKGDTAKVLILKTNGFNTIAIKNKTHLRHSDINKILNIEEIKNTGVSKTSIRLQGSTNICGLGANLGGSSSSIMELMLVFDTPVLSEIDKKMEKRDIWLEKRKLKQRILKAKEKIKGLKKIAREKRLVYDRAFSKAFRYGKSHYFGKFGMREEKERYKKLERVSDSLWKEYLNISNELKVCQADLENIEDRLEFGKLLGKQTEDNGWLEFVSAPNYFYVCAEV